MTELITVPKPNEWSRLKALVLDSVSSPITRRRQREVFGGSKRLIRRIPRPAEVTEEGCKILALAMLQRRLRLACNRAGRIDAHRT